MFAGIRASATNRMAVSAGRPLNSAEAVDVAFTTAGAFRQRLTEASTERYGPFVGIRWRF